MGSKRDQTKQDAALSFFVGLEAENMKTLRVPSNNKRDKENNFLLPPLCQDERFQSEGDEWRQSKLQKEEQVTKAGKKL